jgi:hypothetical protein
MIKFSGLDELQHIPLFSVLEIRFIVNKAAANSVSKTAAAVGKVRAHPLQ